MQHFNMMTSIGGYNQNTGLTNKL